MAVKSSWNRSSFGISLNATKSSFLLQCVSPMENHMQHRCNGHAISERTSVFNKRTIHRALATVVLAIPGPAGLAAAQTAAPANDTPSIHVGVQLFADYTVVEQPKIRDADGNTVTLNQFEIGRSYINVLGNISKTISFR